MPCAPGCWGTCLWLSGRQTPHFWWSPLWTCFPWTIGSHRSSQGVWTACTCSARGSPGWSYSSPLCSQTSAPHKEVLHPGDAVVKLVWRPVQLFLQQQQSGPSGHPSLLWMQKHVFDLILKNIIDTVLNPKYQQSTYIISIKYLQPNPPWSQEEE